MEDGLARLRAVSTVERFAEFSGKSLAYFQLYADDQPTLYNLVVLDEATTEGQRRLQGLVTIPYIRSFLFELVDDPLEMVVVLVVVSMVGCILMQSLDRLRTVGREHFANEIQGCLAQNKSPIVKAHATYGFQSSPFRIGCGVDFEFECR